ncbi:MAG: family peptidase [Segetibacter sp.]|nr:family peptidase [Segetibacter sp.]
MKNLFSCLTLILVINCQAQDLSYGKSVVDTLTSPYFWGRGYTNDGMKKAADYISAQFHSFGLSPMKGQSYVQSFSYPVNTFPGKMELAVNGLELVPAKDFIVGPDSRGIKGKGKLQQEDSTHFVNPGNRVVIELVDKLTWSVATEQADYTSIQIDKKSILSSPSNITFNIESNLNRNFKAANVCGVVKGTFKPDSIIVVTAHYDHLGGMGKSTYFPGANDNASGVSLLLQLAKYYALNPQRYTIAFIAFAGEEAGLIGSKYFTENPLVPLKNIRFLTNVDLVGTGDEGITIVNATEFKKEFELLNSINREQKLLFAINARGKAANSDHYWFTEKGVPTFFMYTLGGIKAYHDVFDKAATLPMNEWADVFKLIVSFNSRLQQ